MMMVMIMNRGITNNYNNYNNNNRFIYLTKNTINVIK